MQQDILYVSLSDGKVRLGLNCTCQTIAAYTPDGRMMAEKQLSPNETRVIQVFFKQYPHFVSDKELQHALLSKDDKENPQKKVFRVVTQLRSRKLAQLSLRILRISQIGYILEAMPLISCVMLSESATTS